jgi:hypothetical protein
MSFLMLDKIEIYKRLIFFKIINQITEDKRKFNLLIIYNGFN